MIQIQSDHRTVYPRLTSTSLHNPMHSQILQKPFPIQLPELEDSKEPALEQLSSYWIENWQKRNQKDPLPSDRNQRGGIRWQQIKQLKDGTCRTGGNHRQ